MISSNSELTANERALDLLHTGAEAELRLLKNERKAERRLAAVIATLSKDERRLQRAQLRVSASKAAVAEAEARLREAQTQRAAGPPPADHD
jgi:hypothetical protein